MNSVFSEQILGDKLSKLNSTQQCIETLSHWCIFHRSKAELVVATWEKQFQGSEMVRKIPLLYLANDILQNSKRKGNEFVSEFWKVLPGALKTILDHGDDHGKTVVSRLVGIWQERRVFGSRGESVKEAMLGEAAPPPLEFGKKRSRSVKIVKRDSRSIRTKLTIGATPEKIVSAFHLVLSDNHNEDAEMSRCKSTVNHVRKMEKDVDVACAKAKDPKREGLATELEDEENILKDCIEKLKSFEANRVTLVSQLREALHEQESELEIIRTQMQVAQAQAEEAKNMKNRLKDEDYVAVPQPSTPTPSSIDANTKPPIHTTKRSAAAIAAEVADKLAASSSSQQIMSSVLSTLAAEAALTKSPTPKSNSFIPTATTNQIARSAPPPPQPQPPPNLPYQTMLVPPSTQPQYHLLGSQQYLQPSGGLMTPYGYATIPPPLPPGPPPPPPLPPPHMVGPMVQMTQQHQMQMGQQQQQQPQPQPQHNFQPLQPPAMVYYATHPRQTQ